MPDVNIEDIERVLAETGQMDNDQWMEKENIPFETIEFVVQRAVLALYRRSERSGGVLEAQELGEIIANSFRIGWECGRELGRHGHEAR